MKRLILIAAATFALSVCATAGTSDYQAASSPGSPGYFTAPADNGRWTVGYTGSIGMSRKDVAEAAMRRAAEFTAEQGKEWFAVIDSETKRVEVKNDANDVASRGSHFLGTGAEAGGSPGEADAPGVGSFGGGVLEGSTPVPNQMMEHWRPRNVYQTALLIQLGSGDKGSFPGLDHTPQIFPAAKPAPGGAHN
ncbi:MAG: hypothetical protein KGJ79_03170 [Alphaproteobacteria bacterium]|nr:hypothetical protein [Alphaproteobacteria bacterium]MDE2110118.1 hypothetical protein [Alphaproteobacteria bacterium]MDE2492764.1 hypothetical protein [Alphaproteobacteria bacterium]